MNPNFMQIADLFGLTAQGSPDPAAIGPRKSRGDTAQESGELGGLSLSEGDYEKAIEHFRRAVDQSGASDPAFILDLGGAYEYADMEPQALRQYRAALRVRQNAAEALLGVAELYKRDGRRRQALVELEQALQANPNHAYCHFKLAELHLELGGTQQALASIQHAIAGAPTDAFYHSWMGDLLIRMRDYAGALDAFRAAIELSPGDDYLYLRAAAAFWLGGRQAEAVKAIRLASDLDPEKDLYHGILEVLLSEMGLDEESDLEAKRAAKMDAYDQDKLARYASELGIVA